jgi:hypothetical protein
MNEEQASGWEKCEVKQASFSGWAKVEVMGHQSHIGFLRTEAYGQAVLFRIDTPELPEREYVLTEPEYVKADGPGLTWTPAGAKVRRAATPGVTVLVGAGSIYRIVPCSEAAAMKAIEANGRSPLKLVELPESKALAAPATDISDSEDDSEEDDGDSYADDEDRNE